MMTALQERRPIYSFRGTSRRWFHVRRLIQLEFYEDKMVINRFILLAMQESNLSPVRTAAYSDIRSYSYIQPRAGRRSTLGGFAWGVIGPGIGISLCVRRNSMHQEKHFWDVEKLEFYGQDNNMDEKGFISMYHWLRDKMDAGN